jgi:hypothetical protein
VSETLDLPCGAMSGGDSDVTVVDCATQAGAFRHFCLCFTDISAGNNNFQKGYYN